MIYCYTLKYSTLYFQADARSWSKHNCLRNCNNVKIFMFYVLCQSKQANDLK